MKSVLVAHCADIHYDSDIIYMGEKGKIRKKERQKSFERILEICKIKEVDYLLIAGDLFEKSEPKEKYVKRLRDEFAKCDGTYIFISPGNHDYICANSPYLREDFWPDNVYIFTDGWEGVEIENDGVSVWGGAFDEMYQREGMLSKCNDDGNIHLGVMHGELADKSLYNPIKKSEIKESNLDYLALGHIHESTDILTAGKTSYAYSGCHDGRGFDEKGICGFYIGEVWNGGCDMEFVQVSDRQYCKIKIDISDIRTDEEVISLINKRISGNEDNIYQIILCGNTRGKYIPDIKNIEEMSVGFFCKILPGYQENDYEMLAKEDTIRGEFTRRMLARGDMMALDIGLMAFDKSLWDRRKYED